MQLEKGDLRGQLGSKVWLSMQIQNKNPEKKQSKENKETRKENKENLPRVCNDDQKSDNGAI